MIKEIFQDCVYTKISWKQIIKNCILIQLLPIQSDKKIYPKIRLMKIFYRNKIYPFAYLYKYIIFKDFNCVISPRSEMGSWIKLPHPLGIVIGENVKIGYNTTIYQNVTLGQNRGSYPVIGNNVIIYANAVIIGDIKIGDNAIIGANSVVLKDVPPNTIVAGSPARTIKGNSNLEGRYF